MAIDFNTDFYLQSKFNQLEEAGQLDEYGLTDVASLETYFEENEVDAEAHYLAAGMMEGINPSADFDTNAYLEAKLAELQDTDQYGDTYADFTIEDVAKSFQEAGLTALEHYNTYGEDEGLEATPVDPAASDLTEALDDLAEAKEGVSAALAAAAETANDAEGDKAREGDELDAYVKQFDEEQLNAAIKKAQGEIDDKEAKVNSEEGTLANARAGTFDDEDARDALADNGTLTAESYMTDANIAKAVSEAQKAVNADDTEYTAKGELAEDNDSNEDGSSSGSENSEAKATDKDQSEGEEETFSAKALQIKANNAEAALNADVNANGTNAELLQDLRGALGDLIKEGVKPDDVSEQLGVSLQDINDAISGEAEPEPGDFITGQFQGEKPAEVDTDNSAADKAVNEVLAELNNRRELITEDQDASEAFSKTESGQVLEAAEKLQDERDGQIEKVSDAEEALADAQSDLAELNGAKDNYDAAVKAEEDAEQYFEDNDLQLPVSLEDSVIATEDNDIFLFSGEEATVAGFGSEGDDQLFIGTDFTWSAVEASVDVAGERVGDADVQEVFAQQVGNNTVLSFEDEAFAGNAQNGDDLTEVTLTGVSANDLSLSDDGFITVA